MNWAELVLRGTLILAAAFGAAYGARRASAALRHFVWTVALVTVLVLPAAMRIAPRVLVGGTKTAKAVRVSTAVSPPPGARPMARVPVQKPQSSPVGLGVALYFAGLLLVIARFAAGAWRMGRIVRVARPATYPADLAEAVQAELGIRRRVQVLESTEAPVPMAWGIARPVVVLPAASHEWPAARLHAVLLHEMVHVARYDLLAQLAAQAACCAYWFHPMVWLAARELRKERERACDDAVLGRGIGAPDYAGHLMEMARAMVERRASLADAPAMAEGGDLEERVKALLDRGRNRAPLTRRMALAVAVLALALVAPVVTLTTYAQAGRGVLAGIVQDPSGGRVPGCEVRIKNLDGGNEEVAKVNEAGEYSFASLPSGRYTIEVRARGFKITKAEAVVTSGAGTRADVSLEMGELSEAITIRGTRTAPAPSVRPAGTPQRIPIGGNVKPARLIHKVDPVYPADLKQQGVTGTVVVRAIVSKTGDVLSPKVVSQNVHPGLAQAALDAARQWRFEPTLLNGQPVEFVTTMNFTFELDDPPALAAAGDAPPVLLLRVEPEYSDEARRAKYQGTVVLIVEVGEDGRAQGVRVQHAIGLGLDEKAIEAVKKWRWKPAMKNGAPLVASATVPVTFRLAE